MVESKPASFHVGPFSPDYYSHALAQLPGEAHFVDFRTISHVPELKGWLDEERTSSRLYEGYSLSRLVPGLRTVRIPIHERFDGIVHIEESTPASLLEARSSRGTAASDLIPAPPPRPPARDRPITLRATSRAACGTAA